MVEVLLKHGADPAAASDDGKTLARLAVENGHPDIANLLAGESDRYREAMLLLTRHRCTARLPA